MHCVAGRQSGGSDDRAEPQAADTEAIRALVREVLADLLPRGRT